MPVLLQAASDADLPGGYGVALLQTLLALAAVCILAWVVLKWAAQRGLGIGAGKRIQIVERVGLDARRALFLVEVEGRVLLLGVGEGAAPALLCELSPTEAAAGKRDGFRAALDRARKPETPSPVASSPDASAPDAPSPEQGEDAQG